MRRSICQKLVSCFLVLAMLMSVVSPAVFASENNAADLPVVLGDTGSENSAAGKALKIDAGTRGQSSHAWAKFALDWEDWSPEGAPASYTVSYDYRNDADTTLYDWHDGANPIVSYALWKDTESDSAKRVGPTGEITQMGCRIRCDGANYLAVPDLTEWHHFTFEVSNGTFQFLIDGEEIYQTTYNVENVLNELLFGDFQANNGGIGYFDNFTVSQGATVYYSEGFDEATITSLQQNGWIFSTSGQGFNTVVDVEPDVDPEEPEDPEEPTGALKIEGARGAVYGYTWRNLNGEYALQSGKDYTVSYYLKNTVASSYSISLWSSTSGTDRNGSAVGPTVKLQYTGGVQYLVVGSDKLPFIGDVSEWNLLEFKVTGNRFTIWINGEQLKTQEGTPYEATLADGLGPVKTLGLFGDVSDEWSNGTILIDDVKVEQDGNVLYLEDFNGRTKDDLRTAGWNFVENQDGVITVDPEENASVTEPEEPDEVLNSLQVSGNGGAQGWARLDNLSVTSDNYSFSFDYKNLDTPDAADESNCFFLLAQFNSGNLLDKLIKHNASSIIIGLPGEAAITVPNNMKKWTHFEIKVNGNVLEVLVDNVSQYIGTVPNSTVKPAQFGWIGDGSDGSYWDGSGLYDNMVLTDNGNIAYKEDFNGKTLARLTMNGWYFSSQAAMAISDMDASDVDGFASLTVEASQTVFTSGITVSSSEILTMTGKMSDGTTVPSNKMDVVYSSDDTDVVEVTEQNGVPAFSFKAAGTANITASLTIDGITKTAEVGFTVINEVKAVSISIGNSASRLALNSDTVLQVIAKMSNMTEKILTETELSSYGLSASSDAESILAVIGFTMKAKAVGSANITVAGTLNGKQVSAKKKFTVASMSSVRAEILSSNLYEGDEIALAARGILSDGSITDITAAAVFTAAGASVKQTEEGKWYLVCTQAGNVTVNVSYGGFTASATAEIKAVEAAKTRSSYYTEERVGNARSNIETYSWAKNTCDTAVAAAEAWLRKYDTYEKLWSAIPSQDIGRTFGVNPNGCLICGREVINEYGNYPYTWTTDEVNWKITCPNCSVSFPTNDFAAYYENGLNEAGEFDAELAKARNDELIASGEPGNLVNMYAVNGVPEETKQHIREELSGAYTTQQIEAILYSMENDLSWGVDDGMGYNWDETDTQKYGDPYTFIGYYAHYAIWHGSSSIVYGMLRDLSEAYLYTGIQKYADAAIILLDRVADVYPEMDVGAYPHNGYYGFTNSDGHHTELSRGRIVGSIWDGTDSRNFLYSYDAIYPGIDTMSQEAQDFLADRTGNPQKGDSERIKVNFEDGLIREVAKAFVDGDLVSNPGMAQSTLAVAAVVMDHYPETQDWLNLDYAPGDSSWNKDTKPEDRAGNILAILANQVSPDGQGDEGALGYNAGWTEAWIEVADVLNGYVLPTDENGNEHALNLPEGTSHDLYLNARFRKMLLANVSLLLTSNYIPNIGDTGTTAKADTGTIIYRDLLLTAYSRLVSLDPEGTEAGDYDVLAQALYLLNSKNSANLRTDIFSEDPTTVGSSIQQVVDEKGELDLDSQNFGAFGLGILRDGEDTTPSTYRGIEYFAPSLSRTYAGGASLDNYPNLDQVNPEGQTGASITYTFNFDSSVSETYQMYIKAHIVKSAWGIWDVYLNGVKINTIDFGNPNLESGAQLLSVASAVSLNATGNTLKFVCAGGIDKMKMGLYNVYFLKQGEEMPPLNIQSDTTQRALWMYYGSAGQGHGHSDPLNLGYIGYDLDLMPDLGYPNTAGGGGTAEVFEESNMAHNTVSFKTATDANYWAHFRNYGSISRFDGGNYVQVMNAATEGVINSGTEYADLFDRTSALIRINESDSYIIDLFRVDAKNENAEYQYNFHTTEINSANTLLTGLSGAQQVSSPGGYANETLKNVYQYNVSGNSFSIDWNVKDTWNVYGSGKSADTDVHMKITMLGASDYSRVLLGEIVPPQNFTSVKGLPSLMVTAKGKTTFTAVMEAYQTDSNIQSVELLQVTENGQPADDMVVRAVKVTLKSGRVDYIVNSLDTSKTFRVAGKFDFKGFFGVYSEENGEYASSYLMEGEQLAGFTTEDSVTGTVSGVTTALTSDNYIDISTEGTANPADLIGKYIHIDNQDLRTANSAGANDPSGFLNTKTGYYVYNAVYEIYGAARLTNGDIRLDIGDTSAVRGLEDDGVTTMMNFNPGSSFTIPLSAVGGQEAAKYTLTVSAGEGGSITGITDGNYAAGESIPVSAAASQGYVFKGWTTSGGGSFAGISSPTTTFTMPKANVTITALFERESSSSSEPETPSAPNAPKNEKEVSKLIKKLPKPGKTLDSSAKEQIRLAVAGIADFDLSEQKALTIGQIEKLDALLEQLGVTQTLIDNTNLVNVSGLALSAGTTDSSVAVSLIVNRLESSDDNTLLCLDMTYMVNKLKAQPKIPVLLRITLPESAQGKEFKLIHIHSDGTQEEVEYTVIDEKTISFWADSFSTYNLVAVSQSGTSETSEIPGTGRSDANLFWWVVLLGLTGGALSFRRKKRLQ